MAVIVPGSALPLTARHRNPGVISENDSTLTELAAARHGELLTAPAQGRLYVPFSRGNGFVADFGGAAGVSVIAAGQTSAVACLYNPTGSGKLVVLERVTIGTATVATAVIAGFALEGSAQTPSSTTDAVTHSFPLGNAAGSASARPYKAATITAMTYLCNIGRSVIATSSAGLLVDFDTQGAIVLAPGYTINLISTITQSSNKLDVSFWWTEWLQ